MGLVVYRVNGHFRAFNYLMEQYLEITPKDIELILWGDLKIMMESSTKENDQELKDGTVIYMLVERRYPLSKELMQRILDLGLEVEEKSTAALQLITCLDTEERREYVKKSDGRKEKTSHLNAVKRIFKYLKGKPHLGLWYPRESPFDLEAFSDSDYGGSNLDRKSTTGGCQFLGQRLISWQCKKQTIVATSTTEAEYVAAANCCGQVLWVQNQLLDYGFNFMNTKIHIDNESTICIVKNPVYHSKTKHIEIRHHFIRDCYEKKLISVEKIHTDLNVADLLTKPFDGPRFNYLVVSIGIAWMKGRSAKSAIANTKADGSLEINATIDTIRYTISEASIRDSLQLDDATGITMLPNDDLFEGMGQIGYPTDGTFTFWKSFFTPQWRYLVHHLLHCISSKSGGWDQFGSNIATALICLSTENKHPYLAVSLTKKIFGNMKRGFQGAPRPLLPSMLLVATNPTIGQENMLAVSIPPSSSNTQPGNGSQTNQADMGNAIVKLVKKVKKLEGFMKRRNLVLTDSEEEELRLQGRKVNTASAEQVSTAEGVNTGSIKLSTGNEQVSTVGTKESTSSQDKGQREGKAPMLSEETPKKSKEQILQEEASLAEAIRLDTLQKEEVAKQVHLDSLLAQRIAEEEELNEQQKKRKAQVQFEAQHYTNEDWDLIRAKIEANAELSKSMLGSELQGEDFARKMVDLVNQRKKYFVEERARAKRNKPMTQSQLKTYMMNYLKNQGTWKLSQLKKLSFEESKKNCQACETRMMSQPRKLKKNIRWRKGMHTSVDKNDSEDSDDVGEQEESATGTETPINPVPVAMKTPSVATYKIIKQGEKGVYQIVREDGTDIVYINFGAMLKSISRDDLTELYRIVMNRYGMDGPEDKLEKGFWKCLRIMFEEPLNTDSIWSELGQQKIISWRYYDTCRVHCLNLESMDVYMLSERKYPLSAEVCQTMLKMKLLDGKMNEDCYRLLKMMEKQAGIRK
ncbi:hypothetical protein Tco_0514630 [Tanacetum coccineum]